jgi:hypothetical protein
VRPLVSRRALLAIHDDVFGEGAEAVVHENSDLTPHESAPLIGENCGPPWVRFSLFWIIFVTAGPETRGSWRSSPKVKLLFWL